MKTSTLNATLSSYTISKAALLCGTGFEAFTQFNAMFGGGHGLIPTLFFSGLICLLFDRTAFVFLEDFAGHIAGQNKLRKSTAAISLLVGTLAYAGTVGFSLMAVPIIADATTTDKSDTHLQMKAATDAATDATAFKVSALDAEIARAEELVNQAQAEASSAKAKAVNAIGGEFARLYNTGNSWVRTAPNFAKQRKVIAEAQSKADANLQEAKLQLSKLTESKRQLISTPDANTSAIIEAASVSVATWQERRTNMRTVTLYVTIGASLVSLLSLLILASYQRIPESRDLTGAIGDFYDGIFALLTEAVHSVNAIFRILPKSKPEIPFEIIEPPAPKVQPIDRDEIRKLRKKIAEYRKRRDAGTLGQIGLDSLQRMEYALKNEKP